VASSKSGATCTAAVEDGSLITGGGLDSAAGAVVPQPATINSTAAITARVIIQPPRFQADNFFPKDMAILLNYC
jgi:hypothetical protein